VQAPIRTGRIGSLVRSCVPRSKGHGIDPETRTFQALRIAVNHELARILEDGAGEAADCLKPSGRLAVIRFSLVGKIGREAGVGGDERPGDCDAAAGAARRRGSRSQSAGAQRKTARGDAAAAGRLNQGELFMDERQRIPRNEAVYPV